MTPSPTPAPTPPFPIITSPLVATATLNLPFTYQFQATGATSLGTANLPPGLTFDPILMAITGTLTGTGTFEIDLSASNDSGTTTEPLVLTVQPIPEIGPVIISSTSATGRTGVAFSFQLQTINGSAATRYDATGLPPNLSIDPLTGFISGIAVADGSSIVVVSAIDGDTVTSATLQLTFVSDPTIPIITSPGIALLAPGQFFSYTITADASGVFSYMGTDGIVHTGPSSAGLPAGLSFDGIATISGVFTGGFGNQTNSAPTLAGGIITNVQLFANGDGGTGTFPLVLFVGATDTVNISTRLPVGIGNKVLIGGFIVSGTGTTRTLIRGVGPSLSASGITGVLQDPQLELRDGAGTLLASNDNWKESQRVPIEATGIPPTNDLESAILAFLSPGAYTAVVNGKDNTTGIGLVEVYDLGVAYPAPTDIARLSNISTRGFVNTGDQVIIGGFIIRPQGVGAESRVVVRGIGPSLINFGIQDALLDPVLQLYDGNGAILMTNDDWQSSQQQEIEATGLAPTDTHESAMVISLPVGSYTAIVRGKNDTTGVALVEVYSLR